MAFYETVEPRPTGWGWEDAESAPNSIREIVSAIYQMERNILHAVESLPDELVWTRVGPDMCAIGNLLMHVRGSVQQWVVHRIGRRPLERCRDQEFAQRGGMSLSTLRQDFSSVMAETRAILARLSEETVREFRAEDGCSIPFILHYTNHHLAVHLGQIIAVREFLSPGFRMYGSASE